MNIIPIPRRSHVKGFTLVEILIVVVILGILASIVVPQFTSAARESRENSLRMDLQRIRTQLEIYRDQHNNKYPPLADIENQLIATTDMTGNPAVIGNKGAFGPYIREFPNNPMTSHKSVGAGAVGTTDWYYNETTGEFRANDTDETRVY